MSLLDDHVKRFNESSAAGDFAPMVAAFAEDAELHFEGVPVGPFVGREAIDAAYRDRPPDDEVEILGVERDGMIVARYAWLPTRPSRRARCASPRAAGGSISSSLRSVSLHMATKPTQGETAMNFKSILIGTENTQRLKDYYTKLFGKPNWDDGGYFGWQIGSGSMTVGPHDQVKGKNSTPGRLIWNIETADVKGEFQKLKAAGATVVKEPYQMGEPPGDDMWITTFSDPDSNYFQLMSPMEIPTEASTESTTTAGRT